MTAPPGRETTGNGPPPPAGGGRAGEDGVAALRCRAPQPELAQEFPPQAGGEEEGEARPPGERRRAAGGLPPSFPPSPGRGRHQPFPAPHTTEGGSPGLLGGPQTKEENEDEPGREGGGGSPGSPRTSAAAASFFARLESTPAAGEVTRGAEGSEQGRRAKEKRKEKRRRKGERERERKGEERDWRLTRIRLKRLLSLGGSGTDGMVRAAPGQARRERGKAGWWGRGQPGRGGCRYEGKERRGGQGEEENPELRGAAATRLLPERRRRLFNSLACTALPAGSLRRCVRSRPLCAAAGEASPPG